MTAVLILAPPRHGTSIVGGILDALGFRMAPDATRVGLPNDANPKGFFNDTDFEGFCNGAFGSYFPQTVNSLTDSQQQRVAEMIAERNAAARWGLKEWRVSLFLPYMIKLIGDCKIIRITRGLDRAVDSWNYHFGSRIQAVTLQDYQRAIALIDTALSSAGLPLLTIDYDAAFDRTEETVGAIAAFVDSEPTSQALSFIDSSLRRF